MVFPFVPYWTKNLDRFPQGSPFFAVLHCIVFIQKKAKRFFSYICRVKTLLPIWKDSFVLGDEEINTMTDKYLNFDEYIRQGEPAQCERADAWRVAIGLQAVDGLSFSDY